MSEESVAQVSNEDLSNTALLAEIESMMKRNISKEIESVMNQKIAVVGAISGIFFSIFGISLSSFHDELLNIPAIVCFVQGAVSFVIAFFHFLS